MTNLQRLTGKIFGETATATGDDPQIGQFGSALNGTYVGTTDVATIQGLPAWSNGFIDSVTPNEQFPPLPEMTGFGKVLSYQTAYTLQKGVPEWDSGTTYYTGDFCKGVGEGKLYVSKVDSNLNHAVTDSTYWEEFSSGATRNVGEIVASTIPLTDAGLHLLDGALISGSGSYSAFVTYIAGLYNSGDYTAIFDTEANWQTAVTTYGVCGKFVYDSVNNTVRLPKYSNKIYTKDFASTASVVGNGVATGYKDDVNEFSLTRFTGSTGQGYCTINAALGTSGSVGIVNKAFGVHTDASKSGLIAQLSNITTSLDGYYYIVIATSTKTEIEVDIDEIATDLNGKADVDLTNCTNTANIKMAHNAMPSDTYTDLTLGASGTTYTAPADGYFTLSKTNGTDFYGVVMINESNGLRMESTGGAPGIGSVIMPASKGDIVTVEYSSSGAVTYFRFIYLQGSESEAS